MAIISTLLSKDPSQQLIKGVFGRFDGEKLHIDPLLQRIYLLSLQKEMDVHEAHIVGFEVPDAHRDAVKANLVAMLQRHWMVLYDSRAPLAGALQSMVRAEQAQVSQHCQSIIQDLNVGAPIETPVILNAHLDRPEYLTDEESSIVTVNAQNLKQYVESASIDAEQNTEYQGLESVDMDAGQAYDATLKLTLPLYGDEAARASFVEKVLTPLIKSGLLESVPTRVMAYQQSERDDESQRFGAT